MSDLRATYARPCRSLLEMLARRAPRRPGGPCPRGHPCADSLCSRPHAPLENCSPVPLLRSSLSVPPSPELAAVTPWRIQLLGRLGHVLEEDSGQNGEGTALAGIDPIPSISRDRGRPESGRIFRSGVDLPLVALEPNTRQTGFVPSHPK
jgi:hypothetical protein